MAHQESVKKAEEKQARNNQKQVRGAQGAPREEKTFEENVIAIDRVARVVQGGRRFRFKALVVVGDGKTKVGVGSAKGGDVQAAIAKATDVAKKSLITIPLTANETIPHDIEVKVSGARVMLKPAGPGTGVIAGGAVRAVLGVTGIRNLLSKSLGSSNKLNIAYATIEALRALVPEDEWVNTPNSLGGKTKARKVTPATTKKENK